MSLQQTFKELRSEEWLVNSGKVNQMKTRFLQIIVIVGVIGLFWYFAISSQQNVSLAKEQTTETIQQMEKLRQQNDLLMKEIAKKEQPAKDDVSNFDVVKLFSMEIELSNKKQSIMDNLSYTDAVLHAAWKYDQMKDKNAVTELTRIDAEITKYRTIRDEKDKAEREYKYVGF